jgi:HEAT repeat protein
MVEPRTSVARDGEPDLHPLLQALRDDAFWVREKAAEALGASRSPDAVSGLLSALEDRTSTVRERAAEALARIGSERALRGLSATLGEKKANEILARVGATEAVEQAGPMPEEQMTSALQQDLRHDLYEQRWHAAQELWNLQGFQAVEDLLQALQEPALEHRSHTPNDVAAGSPISRPDEYTLFDVLSHREFQAGWHLAQDLVRMDPEYAAYVFERVLDLGI